MRATTVHRVHVLTNGFVSPNARAFLFPLAAHRYRLAEYGIDLHLITDAKAAKLTGCDVLFVESQVFRHRWAREGDAPVLTDIAQLAERTALVWFDISDSSGWLQAQVLPFVRRYYKAQLLRDRTLYMRPLYGNRIWTDYYHREFGICDDVPAPPRVVEDAGLLDKLAVSWHSGLADHSRFGPLRMALRQRLPVDRLLQYPTKFTAPDAPRPNAVACRMGVDYQRATVAHQRLRIRELLGDRAATEKLSRRDYFREMQQTQLAISPFGFGEITLKDFEAMLCGSALLKPDLSHMETWPDLFASGETILTHRWDMSDLISVIDQALAQPNRLSGIAAAAQTAYRTAIASPQGHNAFCRRVRLIVDDAVAVSGGAIA